MEIRTNAQVSFTRTLFVRWIQFLSSNALDDEDGKNETSKDWRTFSSLDATYSENINIDSFSWQNSCDIDDLVYKECSCFFNSSTK